MGGRGGCAWVMMLPVVVVSWLCVVGIRDVVSVALGLFAYVTDVTYVNTCVLTAYL